MENCRLKRESMLSTGKLDKIVPGLQENKTHLQKVNQCVFVEKTALQNSFMKQELVLYINDSRKSEDITNVFKLCDLVDLYTFCNQNIEQLGLTENKVHNTRLKEQLLAYFMICMRISKAVKCTLHLIRPLVLLLQKQLTIFHLVKATAIV